MGVQTQPWQIRKGGFLRPPLKPHWTQNFTHSQPRIKKSLKTLLTEAEIAQVSAILNRKDLRLGETQENDSLVA